MLWYIDTFVGQSCLGVFSCVIGSDARGGSYLLIAAFVL